MIPTLLLFFLLMIMDFNVIAIKTGYFKPYEGYSNLVREISSCCEDDDIIFISETPISTIEGNLVDESGFTPGFLAVLITEFWCRYLWGYILCPLFGYGRRTTLNLRNMPVEARKHKEFILERYGLKHALQPTAEAGVDLSNVPGSCVSLLPDNPCESARIIKKLIFDECGKSVDVVIIDTDPTYSFLGRYYTTLPLSIEGIHNDTGVFGYVVRIFSKRIGATVLASTADMNLKELFMLANLCEDCQRNESDNFFETVYNMKDTFKTGFDEISVEMLEGVEHVPAVIIRKPNYL